MRRAKASLVALLMLSAWLGAALAVASPQTGKGGLPRLAPTVLPAPEPAQVAEIDQALSLVASAKQDEQKAGARSLHDGGQALLPALARRLSELRKSANRDAMGIYVSEARKGRGRDDEGGPSKPKKKRKDEAAAQKPEGIAGPDWLALVTQTPHPADQPYKDLVAVLAIERALVDIGTTPAVRELTDVYLYFGDLFRIDVQHMVARLGDRAVPALIEARKHDAEKMRRWASRQLDALGKAIPGEAVQVADPEVLADVLRAFGRTKEIDALRVVVSFTSSDRVHVREAAREALVSYGDAALWQLREAHESLTGKRPPPGESWDKLAADLFEAHDRGRLEEIIGLFDDGQSRQKEGKLGEMAALFDSVLARAPTFERRSEMSVGYFDLAQTFEKSDPERALLLARKALRLDAEGPKARTMESFILTLEGEEHLARGLVDTAVFKRALEIDPGNERARRALAKLEINPRARPLGLYRYLAALVIGLTAIAAAFFVGIFRRSRPVATGGSSSPPPPAPPRPTSNPPPPPR